jgi:hypothetical protein
MDVSPVNWRPVETTNHVLDGQSVYSCANSAVLNQFVYGMQCHGVIHPGARAASD